MADLKTLTSQIVASAFAELGLPAELGQVTASKQEGVHFQCNGLFVGAKQLNCTPEELYNRLIEIIDRNLKNKETV
jgi:arginyl-tRNA synthetase